MTQSLPAMKREVDNLNKAPHVLSQFSAMLCGEQQLSPTQEQEVWEHLGSCLSCQTFLGHYLLDVIESHKMHNEPEGSARELLTKLIALMHETLKEDIPAYVEEVVAGGEGAANTRFPLFAEHLPTCQICQLTVRNMHAWLLYDTDDGDA